MVGEGRVVINEVGDWADVEVRVRREPCCKREKYAGIESRLCLRLAVMVSWCASVAEG